MIEGVENDAHITSRAVLADLHKRALNGFKHSTFQQAFLVGVVFAGGMGIWLEIYKLIFHNADSNLAALRGAISTFFPAVIGATSLQMAFEDKVKANRGIAFCSVFILLIVFMLMGDDKFPNLIAFPLGVLASLISLWVWCAANGNSLSFQEELPVNSSIGDLPLDAPLQGNSDLDKLTH